MPAIGGQRNAGGSNAAQKRGKWLGLLCGFLSLGLFLIWRDLINWKVSDAEGDRKTICSLGEKGLGWEWLKVESYCMEESRGGGFR